MSVLQDEEAGRTLGVMLMTLGRKDGLRGRAGYIIPGTRIRFSPRFFSEKMSFPQQLCCFQYNRPVGNTPYGKRHTSRNRPGKASAVYLARKLTFTPFFFKLQVDH